MPKASIIAGRAHALHAALAAAVEGKAGFRQLQRLGQHRDQRRIGGAILGKGLDAHQENGAPVRRRAGPVDAVGRRLWRQPDAQDEASAGKLGESGKAQMPARTTAGAM